MSSAKPASCKHESIERMTRFHDRHVILPLYSMVGAFRSRPMFLQGKSCWKSLAEKIRATSFR
jgi:hypothetical protein